MHTVVYVLEGVHAGKKRERTPLTYGLMSVSVADQGNFYKDFCGYSGARRALGEEKSSRRLVGVILPNQHSLSFCLSLICLSLSFSLMIL